MHNLTAVNIKTMDAKKDDKSTRRQVNEIKTKSDKLDELIVQRGSRTLICYIMTSMESVLGAVHKTTGELISQLSDPEKPAEKEIGS